MNFYLPWYAHMGAMLRSFDVPGWNPFISSGTPFAGDPQSGWTYAPAMFFFTILPPAIGYKLFFAFHLALGGVATYTLARLLSFGALASFAAGAVFASGQNLGATRCCTNHLQLVVWIPVGMIGIELAGRAETRTQRLAALSLAGFAGSQMVAGWIGQGAYNGFLTLGTYLFWRSLVRGDRLRSWRDRIFHLLRDGFVVFGIAIGLSAAGLFPRLDAIRRTFLGTDEYQGANFAPDRGWDWPHVLSVLVSFRLDWHPYYLGGAVVACAVAALAVGGLNRTTGYFAAFVAVVIVLPARPTPLHELFYLLPRFRGLHLHDPGRVLAILPVGIAILAAVTVAATSTSLPARWLPFLAVLVGGTGIGLVLLDRSQPWSIAPITWGSFLGAVLAFTLWGIASRTGRYAPERPRSPWLAHMVPTALVLLILADPAGRVVADDLGSHPNDAVLDIAIAESVASTDPGGAGEFLQARQAAGEIFRYYGYMAPEGPLWQGHEVYMRPDVLPVLANNRSMRLGLHDVQGYNPAQIERYRVLFEVVNGLERDYHEALIYQSGLLSPLLDMLNVRYILVPANMRTDQPGLSTLFASLPEVFRNDEVRVLENVHALPRAWLVHTAQQVDEQAATSFLSYRSFDPRRVVLLEGAPPPLEQPPAGSIESVEVTEYGADRVRLTVEAASPGVVVLGDVFDPGWKAYVDGQRVDVYAANLALRAVAVPAGSHVVEFRYEPLSLRVGMAISGLSLLVVIAILGAYIRSLRMERRNQSANQETVGKVYRSADGNPVP